MPRKSNSRAAQGAGTIRKKTVTRNSQAYTYWEARITTGYDPGTGRQIQRSFSGKTQKEVREKMQAAAVELNTGTYKEPLKMTVGEWLDIWEKDYLNNVKPRTREIYKASIRNHLKPALGAIRLEALDTPTIQAFYNGLSSPCKTRDHALSPKTIKDLHGILHKALSQAVAIGYLRFNPADACNIPKVVRKELTPLDTEDIQKFLTEIRGNPFEILLSVTLFMGLREGEVLALSWHNIDFEHGTVLINCQLQRFREDINRSKIKETSDTNTDFDDLDGAIRSGYFLKDGLSNNEDFYYLNLLITVTAGSVDDLEWKVAEMKKLLLSQDMDVQTCSFCQEQAFLSSLPLVSLERQLYERSKRNVLTTGAASCYPFTSYEMCDDNGILLGVNKHNNSLIIVDIFDSRVYKNANIAHEGYSTTDCAD